MPKIAKIIPLQKMPRGREAFDYLVSDEMAAWLKPGQILNIPFGRRNLVGLFLALADISEFSQLKHLEDGALTAEQLLPWQVEFLRWFSQYYSYSMASTLKLMLPEKPKRKMANKLISKLVNWSSERIEKKSDGKVEAVVKQIVDSADKKYLLFPYSLELKMELYKSLIKKTLRAKSQLLLLFPRVEMAEALAAELTGQLKEKTVIMTGESHSSKSRHYQMWQDIQNKKYNVVIGTRSAIFAPLTDCQMIIVDEAESDDYKQWDQNPRYSAITAVKKIQALTKSKIILSSLAPRVEEVYAAKMEKWKFISLGNERQPQITICDLTKEREAGFTFLGSVLMTEAAASREALLIVNKKGEYSQLLCQDCGYSPKCPKCEMELKVGGQDSLQCYRCQYLTAMILVCPKCTGTKLKKMGLGIEQVEKVFKARKQVHLSTGQNIEAGLFQKIDFLGLVHVDSLLHLADFNSNFKLYSFLQNIIYRAINANPRVKILIQTSFPDNLAIKSLAQGYGSFYQGEIEQRKELLYPPFSQMIKIFFQHHDFGVCEKEAKAVYLSLQPKVKSLGGKISPPYLYYLNKIRERYRYQLAIFLPKEVDCSLVLTLVPEYWTIDKDPINLL